MKKFILLFFVGFYSFQSLAQEEDTVGSGRAIFFDGIDDYISLGNVYDDLSLPVTISVWVNVSKAAGYAFPVFNSQDNLPLYNGITFLIQPESISIQYGDGRGENNPAFRRGKAAVINDISGRWVNVTAIMRGASDMDLFLNGMNVGGFYDGSSTFPMHSDSPVDDAKIGYWFSNGITSHYKGLMDELRIYNKSLSVDEIRQHMCKRLSGNEPGLIGYWTFDEKDGTTLKDKSNNNFIGTLSGNPQRVFSGAPIGDESVFLYDSDWTGKSVLKNDLSVSKVSGNPYGVHIYTVNQTPSQTGGLDTSKLQLPYYGVFLADDGQDNVFDFSFIGNTSCDFFQRKENSERDWITSGDFSGIHRRIEVIRSSVENDLNVNLGADITLCDETSFVLEAHPEPSGKTFLWNTGETTPSIIVTSSGEYSVEVKWNCTVDRDTLLLSFHSTPPPFLLGEDELLCYLESRLLTVDLENDDFDFTWHNGSSEKSFVADDFGTYWLKLENACGYTVDSITFTQKVFKDLRHVNFISPDNKDHLNQFFILDDKISGAQLTVFNRWGKQVYETFNYHDDWDGRGLPSGVYLYTIRDSCGGTYKGTLTIMR